MERTSSERACLLLNAEFSPGVHQTQLHEDITEFIGYAMPHMHMSYMGN